MQTPVPGRVVWFLLGAIVASGLHFAWRMTAIHDVPSTQSSTPDSAQKSAQEEGKLIVERAIAAGYWKARDAADFTAASARMRGEDSFELRRQLVVAINEDRVKVEPGAERGW